jgi:hypothetical protein
VGKYGTNLEGFGAFEGGVNADKGAPLVSTSSDGETALLFGPAALREIQAGVANGDFAIPPDDGDAIITEENPLPYWTFTDTSSNGAITCKIVDDASSGSSNTLRWSIAAATANSKSAKLTRFIPVASTRNRAFAYAPEVNTFGATNTANSTIRMQAQFYKADQTTTTGTAIDSGALTFATLGTGSNYLIGAFTTALAAPADAAFCLVTITVATAAAGAVVASTIDIPEVRLIRGDQTNLFAEYTAPGTYAPTTVRQINGTLNISPNAGTGSTTLGGDLTVSGGDINLGTGFTVSGLGVSLFEFTRNDSGNRANIAVGRVFPGTQTTRYIDDDGSRTTVSAGFVIGSFTSTATAANVNTTSNTNGLIRIVSSSRRWKENIEDADQETLAAAKLLKARHFNSLHPSDNNARLLGMIAEEVEEAGLDCAVEYDDQGLPLAINWSAITAALLVRLEDAERRIADLESR